jgi:hypothetical protein
MEAFHDFFAASVGAAAALIGLLFVAISLDPEHTLGPNADRERSARSIGAFSALANVFFVSLGGLIPKSGPYVIAVVAVVSLVQTVTNSVRLARQFPEFRGFRAFGRISLAINLLELVVTVRIMYWHGTPDGLIYTLLGLYSYALGTAWTLLRPGGTQEPAG